MERVHRPELVKLIYTTSTPSIAHSQSLVRLQALCQYYDFEKDPYILELRKASNNVDLARYNRTKLKQKTYCFDQLKRFFNKSIEIYSELGPWATDHYIHSVVTRFSQDSLYSNVSGFESTEHSEKLHLAKLLISIKPHTLDPDLLLGSHNLTSKVQTLLDYLEVLQAKAITGLVFVQTRAACAVLAHILSEHPKLKAWLRVGTFMGASSIMSRRANIGELIDIKDQQDTLDHLRNGKKNLIVTTSALEEGIDVSACNLVICFEKPPLLKSFIQRRGRARKEVSWYVLLFKSDDEAGTLASWQEYEEEMRRQYEDDMRQREAIRRDEEEIGGQRILTVPSTGAKLSFDDVLQHLYHFCDTLPHDLYADHRPTFEVSGGKESFSVTVRLPNSVDNTVREARSSRRWPTEKLARRDAALEAYTALYRNGLVTDHLLPLRGLDEVKAEAYQRVQRIESLIDVESQFSIWPYVASAWQEPNRSTHRLRLRKDAETMANLLLHLPVMLPDIPVSTLYWDEVTELAVEVVRESVVDTAHCSPRARAQTDLLLRSVFNSRMPVAKDDFSVFFCIPCRDENVITSYSGNWSVIDTISDAINMDNIGLIRDSTSNGRPYIFHGTARRPVYLARQPPQPMPADHEALTAEIECLQVKSIPKRTDFLHSLIISERAKVKKGTGFQFLIPSDCTVDRLPSKFAKFALLIPSILHVVENNLVAEHLAKHLLKPVNFQDFQLVLEAITATAARETNSYQRLEFLGDSHLKYLTSLTLLSQNPRYHEGILSHKKDHIVSNANLARATLACGLDKYIRTVPFTGKKWRPMYNSDFLDENGLFRECCGAKREISTKALADVVEALIGAAYLDGGTLKALECLKVLLPSTRWAPVHELVSQLSNLYATTCRPYPVHFAELEELLGYTFNNPSLLTEALTHPAYQASDSFASYQRLEFLGDSIIDVIVSTKAFKDDRSPSVHRLHLIRTALVNADILAFFCMHHSKTVPKKTIVADDTHETDDSGREMTNFQVKEEFIERHVWHFLRHTSPTLRGAQVDCHKRFVALQEPIMKALEQEKTYPWALLASLDAPKFFSDIMESTMGAIYIDSRGDLRACEAFLERFGILKQLDKVLNEDISLMHPKEELGIVANQNAIKYIVRVAGRETGRIDDAAPIEHTSGRLICSVFVGDQEIVTVAGGFRRLEIETRAAQEAVRLLTQKRQEKRKELQGEGETMGAITIAMDPGKNLRKEERPQKRRREANSSESEDDDTDERDQGNKDDGDKSQDGVIDSGEIFYDADEDVVMGL